MTDTVDKARAWWDAIAEKNAEITRLRKGIQDYLDGNYGRSGYFKTKHDKCPHGLFDWEACENCIDAYFAALLRVSQK